jgi:hypothetical protein
MDTTLPPSPPPPVKRPSAFAPAHWYNVAMAKYIHTLRVRDKRNIYVAMRQKPLVTADTFLPKFGVVIGEFAGWQVLNDKPRKTTAGGGAGSVADVDDGDV